MRLTFKRGIHPNGMKELSMDCPFEDMPTGEKVYIPLWQHAGAPATACVEEGDYVKAGTKIGNASGYISANIHSSVSGRVAGFCLRENAQGKKIKHIIIENDGKYEEELLPPIEDSALTRAKIIERCREAGVAGMGGATFPTHVKLETNAIIKTLIINGSECEPYITTDYRLMLDKPVEVLKGIEYVRIAVGAPEVKIGIEGNKPEAIAAMKAALTYPNYHIFELKTKYPQGGEKQLIYALSRTKVPVGGLPSDIGYIVINISTCYALYEAVALGKPSFSRFMTASGLGFKRQANLFVRFGVPFSEIADYLGTDNDYVKAISGGPMMGLSLFSLEPVVTKGSSSFLLLTEPEIRAVDPTPCINCGRCAEACSMKLMPMKVDDFMLHDRVKEAKEYNAQCCIECGCCAFVCPAKRPLVQSMRLAKKLIKERNL